MTNRDSVYNVTCILAFFALGLALGAYLVWKASIHE